MTCLSILGLGQKQILTPKQKAFPTMTSPYIRDRFIIVRMMRALKGMPQDVLDNPAHRLSAYEQAGIIDELSKEEYTLGQYEKLDKAAHTAEIIRQGFVEGAA
jgi:hypothetical protein